MRALRNGQNAVPSEAFENEAAPESGRGRLLRTSDVRELQPVAEVDETLESSLSPSSAARRLVTALIARGVDTFFGIPGGPVCPIFEAIRCTPRARLIESRHESHAAFAAALYYRASGRVPALVVTAGPGVTNAVSGIASASLERTPMLVIAGDVAWATTGGCLAHDSGPEGIALRSHARRFAPQRRAAWSAKHSLLSMLPAIRGVQGPRCSFWHWIARW
jgi:Thiamine pyrophosphate enzyme, N-terminal TPP binding domain